jgi:hypothetical protein
MKTKISRKRGTDEAFLQLMSVSGSGVLKLFGISSEKADKYRFRAVVLKDKKLEPDVEAIPMLYSDDGRIFIEFQAYEDKFIRHRLAAQVFWASVQNSYPGKVMAGIIYTDKKYQTAALSLNRFMGTENCQLKDCFHEIVLTSYTEKALRAIDPKLIILAPFTLDVATEKGSVLAKGREWGEEVKQVFSIPEQRNALNILGLFVLNRFRNFKYEEVRAMLNFDLMDTVAGKQLYDMGHQKGIIEDAQEMVIEALVERFDFLPNEIVNQISTIEQPVMLKKLLRQAIRCQDIENFKETLAKAINGSQLSVVV